MSAALTSTRPPFVLAALMPAEPAALPVARTRPVAVIERAPPAAAARTPCRPPVTLTMLTVTFPVPVFCATTPADCAALPVAETCCVAVTDMTPPAPAARTPCRPPVTRATLTVTLPLPEFCATTPSERAALPVAETCCVAVTVMSPPAPAARTPCSPAATPATLTAMPPLPELSASTPTEAPALPSASIRPEAVTESLPLPLLKARTPCMAAVTPASLTETFPPAVPLATCTAASFAPVPLESTVPVAVTDSDPLPPSVTLIPCAAPLAPAAVTVMSPLPAFMTRMPIEPAAEAFAETRPVASTRIDPSPESTTLTPCLPPSTSPARTRVSPPSPLLARIAACVAAVPSARTVPVARTVTSPGPLPTALIPCAAPLASATSTVMSPLPAFTA